jgi:hypothetical protein
MKLLPLQLLLNGDADLDQEQVDLLIVVVSVLGLLLEALLQGSTVLVVLRILRAIKALRLITHSASVLEAFQCLVLSLAAMLPVCVYCSGITLAFAILGTQLFMGMLWRCVVAGCGLVCHALGQVCHTGGCGLAPRWAQNLAIYPRTGATMIR